MPGAQALERAATAPATRGNPLLWRVYLAHELAAGRPDAARRVFLRAVHACAWAKVRPLQLYGMAAAAPFHALRRHFVCWASGVDD